MSQISCSFCTNPNPPEAKFCTQCGSPLGLKPCPACEAVNAAAAERCRQCGAAFNEQPVADVPGPAQAVITPESAIADATQVPPAHIPESLADRLERDAGAHVDGRIEPRISRPEERHEHVVEASSPGAWNTRMPPRRRAWRAPLTIAVLVAIAGAGYYAYKYDAPGIDRLAEFALAGRHADEPASAERQSTEAPAAATGANDAPADAPPVPAQSAPSAPGTATPAQAGSDAQRASEANPAAAALVTVQPGAPGRAATDAETAASSPVTGAKARARPSSSASRNDDEAARQRSESASRSRRQADADAIATQRLIARDLGTVTAPPANAPAAPLDRDSAETQRLIERDLGPFLHRNDRSLRGGTYPAVD